MDVRATLDDARMGPRKLRRLRPLVVGQPVAAARALLTYQPGKGARLLQKLLKSAVANAQHNHDLVEHSLLVKDVIVDGAASLKRYMPVGRGVAHPIRRRTAHVTMVVKGTPVGVKGKRPSSKIETVAAETLATRGELPRDKAPEERLKKGKGQAHVPRHEQEGAYQKIKMMQKGGDQKKSFRRKSVG